jgi:hypothetical protein
LIEDKPQIYRNGPAIKIQTMGTWAQVHIYIYIVLHMYIYIIYIYIMICMLCTYSLPDPLFAVPTFLTPASHPSKPEGAADAAKTRRRARRGDQPGNSQACETPVPQEYV